MMGSHPINLAVRFVLEIGGLIAMGTWAWNRFEDGPRLGLSIGIPLIAAGIWGTFNVPGDPSRSGQAPVRVPGFLRLLIEAAFFVFAAWAVYSQGSTALATIFATIVILHYALSYDRIGWLLQNPQTRPKDEENA
jgi:hypothetical protein